MSFQELKTHNFGQYILTISSQLIGGFGNDGGVQFEWAGDEVEDEAGADGEVTANVSNDRRLYADVNLRENSQGYARLVALWNVQKEQSKAGSIQPMPLESFNPRTGERVFSRYTIFKSRPTPSVQKSAEERTLRLLLPYPELTPPTTQL